jgi:hypothetical protein
MTLDLVLLKLIYAVVQQAKALNILINLTRRETSCEGQQESFVEIIVHIGYSWITHINFSIQVNVQRTGLTPACIQIILLYF